MRMPLGYLRFCTTTKLTIRKKVPLFTTAIDAQLSRKTLAVTRKLYWPIFYYWEKYLRKSTKKKGRFILAMASEVSVHGWLAALFWGL
jgi:hypothetical protein